MTTIWIDAHLSPAIATWINNTFEITAFALREVGLRDAEDLEIFEAAKAQGRYIMNEAEPEKGYFFRSDHFNFAKKGVPALYAEGSYDHWEKGVEYA